MNSLKEHYQNLYNLQDEVLSCITPVNSIFYLTGGTALGRYYLHHRYSDDIDLFASFHPKFELESEKLVAALKDKYSNRLKMQINQEFFKRMFVEENNDIVLKIEIVNDIGYHLGDFASAPFFNKIDNWQNILANKITALSRNAEKDLVDILFLAYKYSFNWKEMIIHAKEKDTWVEETKVASYFEQIEIISSINWISEEVKEQMKIDDFKIIARDILLAKNNTLYKK